jgi:dTDP-4-dehydrorhamnose reductase
LVEAYAPNGLGEQIVKGNAMIVRIAYPYGNPVSIKPDLVTKLKSLLAEGKELTFMTDSTITPTFIEDIAPGLKYLFNHYDKKIYHLVGSQSVTPYELAELICERWNFDKKLLKPTTWKEYSVGKAPRPQYSTVISKYNTFHKMKSVKEALGLL